MSTTNRTKFNLLQFHSIVLLIFALAIDLISTTACAQKGMGGYEGVGRQRIKPPIVRLSGIMKKIETHPCKNTTGRAELGTHLIIKDTRNNKLNIHLGPSEDVNDIVRSLSVGSRIDILGFRTEQMPANQYVAKTLILSDQVIHLRDSMLRPYWSRNSFLPAGRRINAPEVGPRSRDKIILNSGYGFQRRRCPRSYCGYGRCFGRRFGKRGFGCGFRYINRRW